jgi:DNA invertase Pin-like site-specific DNA recombinase
MKPFAFYGRVSTEDQQDPTTSRNWQLARSRSLIGPHGGEVVAEYFDVGTSRSLPWKRRPQATELLHALRDPGRAFDAVVIGEPARAFYGNQFSLTFPVFVHYGVDLWVPEVGGAVDPGSDAHDLVMSLYGGMSKGKRNRIKIRVRSAMAAQAATEGRFLGGRSPYGYRLVDLGPHPNPGKAAAGQRRHGLEPDPVAAPVVKRIFREYVAGKGLYVIAEALTRDGIACPSAHDRTRNRHRDGIAWSKSAVRAILRNPRYTGRQVWNRQRRDEVLIDVDDVALGHETNNAGIQKGSGSGQPTPSTNRSSAPRCSKRHNYKHAQASSEPSTASPAQPVEPTRCDGSLCVACVADACKGHGSQAARATAAATPTSTGWPTRSNIPATSTFARTRSCRAWTPGSAACSTPRTSTPLSPP